MNHEDDRTKCNTYSTAPTAKRTNTSCPDAAWVFELLAIRVLITISKTTREFPHTYLEHPSAQVHLSGQ